MTCRQTRLPQSPTHDGLALPAPAAERAESAGSETERRDLIVPLLARDCPVFSMLEELG